MIAIDWGTTNFRAFRIRAGVVVGRVPGGPGILAVPPGGFAPALHAAIGPWLQDGERHVLMAGMVGSRQGWIEAPYLPCPADAMDLAAAAIRVPFDAADVRLVPGLTTTMASASSPSDIPDVMRGEEVQLAGILKQVAPPGALGTTVCLPGTHSKWARICAGRISGFTTHMTGEAFAALRDHTILGRLMAAPSAAHDQTAPSAGYDQTAPIAGYDPAAFQSGVDRSGDPGGLLSHLFGTRTLGLFGRLDPAHAASYMSGLLIGHEVRAAMGVTNRAATIHLVGSRTLCALYADALTRLGATPVILNEDAAADGLWRLSEHIAWT